MESIRKLYRIGVGPSSSHTMAPRRAAMRFLAENPDAAGYRVTLFASLAATGKGHLTDRAICDAFSPRPVEIIWREEANLPFHPNGMRFESLDGSGNVLTTWEVYSVGGGALSEINNSEVDDGIYPLNSMAGIMAHSDRTGDPMWAIVENIEGGEIWEFLDRIWTAMTDALKRGLATEGALPGGLGVARKALSLHRKASMFTPPLQQNGLLAAYAYAVSEENASGGVIVTAPTCGACGVLPAVLHFLAQTIECTRQDILRALATAGLIGNLVKTNGSISGAEVGCQGEVGTACSMAAGAAAQLLGGTIRQIEYAAEMGLEHHLGLTCDPVAGLVQIPCIERNAHAATRALSCAHFALLSDGSHIIPFDEVVLVMKETGQALPHLYRETSAGGLARAYRRRKDPPQSE